jgi:hypothetical protein
MRSREQSTYSVLSPYWFHYRLSDQTDREKRFLGTRVSNGFQLSRLSLTGTRKSSTLTVTMLRYSSPASFAFKSRSLLDRAVVLLNAHVTTAAPFDYSYQCMQLEISSPRATLSVVPCRLRGQIESTYPLLGVSSKSTYLRHDKARSFGYSSSF